MLIPAAIVLDTNDAFGLLVEVLIFVVIVILLVLLIRWLIRILS